MRTLYTITTLLVLCAGVCVGAFLFVSGRVHTYHARADSIQNTVVLAEQKAINADAQRKVLRELAQKNIGLDSFFFVEGDALAFLRILEKTADAQGVDISVLSVDSVHESRAPLGAFLASVELQGSFEGIVSFLARVNTLPYALKTRSFSMEVLEGDTETTWTAVLSVAGAYITTEFKPSISL